MSKPDVKPLHKFQTLTFFIDLMLAKSEWKLYAAKNKLIFLNWLSHSTLKIWDDISVACALNPGLMQFSNVSSESEEYIYKQNKLLSN